MTTGPTVELATFAGNDSAVNLGNRFIDPVTLLTTETFAARVTSSLSANASSSTVTLSSSGCVSTWKMMPAGQRRFRGSGESDGAGGVVGVVGQVVAVEEGQKLERDQSVEAGVAQNTCPLACR